MRYAFVLAWAVACAAPRARETPELPPQLELVDMERATRTRGWREPRFVPAERAMVDAAVASCGGPRSSASVPAPRSDHDFDDSLVQEAFARESAAAANPPAVRCHIYVGEPTRIEEHLAVRAGERTHLRREHLVIELGFAIDIHEGSSFLVSVRKHGNLALQYGRTIFLSAMPASCGAPGFTGWLRDDRAPELRMYCESS